jgi:hypothetical protein
LRLDETKQREVCAILAVGGTRRMAAHYVGCHPETIRRRALREPEFAAQLRRAEVTPEITLLRSIQAAAADPKQWRAAAWALERLYPDRYAARGPRTIGLDQMKQIVEQLANVVLSEVPVKQYRGRILKRLAALVAAKEKAANESV